jgi:hypothetical protein
VPEKGMSPKVTTKNYVMDENKGFCTVTKINKELVGRSVQIQKQVPQCNMTWPVRAQVAWKEGGGWGPHRWVSVLGEMNGGQSVDEKTNGG